MSLLTRRSTLRHPAPATEALMSRRGWWLVLLGFLLPGSAQVLAGNRKLGRVGLIATFTLLGLLLVALVLWFVWRWALITVVANSIGLLVIEVLAVAYAVLWLVLGLDTLRIARPGRAGRKAGAFLAAASLIVTLVPVGAAAYAASVVDASRGLVSSVFTAGGAPQAPIDGQYTFMLLGGDAGADREGLRPDSITVVSVNADTGAATMIGVPRNLNQVPFPADSPMHAQWPDGFNCGTSDCLINAAYTYGMGHQDLYPDAESQGSNAGIEATRDAIEGALGIPIQYAVIVDMQGFGDLVDALGGVEITVTERVPIAITGGPVEEWIEPGTQTLDGYHALWYARSRADSSDYARMERQRQVQQAVIAQFTPQVLLTKYGELSAAGQDLVQTDIPQSMIGYFTDLADRTRTLPITTLELVPPEIDPADPDFDAIHEMVQDAIARAAVVDQTPAPS